jgi:hypothetical protein
MISSRSRVHTASIGNCALMLATTMQSGCPTCRSGVTITKPLATLQSQQQDQLQLATQVLAAMPAAAPWTVAALWFVGGSQQLGYIWSTMPVTNGDW